MPKFDTRIVQEIKAAEIVEELVIDGVGQLQKFENELSGTPYETQLESLILYVQHIADGGRKGKKLKILSNSIAGGMELEFISHDLRLYAIQRPGKKIIIFGGKKKASDSSDNIKKFRLIKARYIDFLNTQK